MKVYGRKGTNKSKAYMQESVDPSLIFKPEEYTIQDRQDGQELWVEVGIGRGEHLLSQARMHPNALCVGCDVFQDGVVHLLQNNDIGKNGEGLPPNLRIFQGDGVSLLEKLPPKSVHRFFLLFPDPWPKKRHHKRRWIQQASIELLKKHLHPDGEIRIATDHLDYQDWVEKHMQNHFHLTEKYTIHNRPSLDDWPITRYEAKALEGRDGIQFYAFKNI